MKSARPLTFYNTDKENTRVDGKIKNKANNNKNNRNQREERGEYDSHGQGILHMCHLAHTNRSVSGHEGIREVPGWPG